MRNVSFQQKLKGAYIQAKIYGWSALLVDEGDDGFPDNVKILNSKLLAQVIIDENSRALQQIQYNTSNNKLLSRLQSGLLCQHLIYVWLMLQVLQQVMQLVLIQILFVLPVDKITM